MAIPVGRSVLIYTCAFAVAGGTPFLLLPILTHQLSPQQFGEVTSFLILTAMLANIAGLSTPAFVSVRYFKSPALEFKGLATSAALVLVATHAIAAMVVASLFPQLQQLLGLPFGLALLAVAAALMLSLNLLSLAIFQSSGQPTQYLASRMIQGLVELLLCLGLLALFTPASGSRIYSYIVAVAASAAFGLHLCRRRGHLGGSPSRAHLRSLATFGLPMLPHIVAGSSLTYLDRIVVSSLLGVESLGVYMVSMQIGMAMVVLIEPLNRALAPWLFEQLSKNQADIRRMIVRKTYQLYGALIVVGSVIATVSVAFFDDFIGAEYRAARSLIPWMIAGFVMQGFYYTVVNYVFYAEWTGRLSVISVLTVSIGCVISYSLTSSLGLRGAGISFALNNCLLFLLVWVAASKAVPMPWLPRRAMP